MSTEVDFTSFSSSSGSAAIIRADKGVHYGHEDCSLIHDGFETHKEDERN